MAKAKLAVVVGFNTLDRSTWQRYENVPLLKILKENFGDSVPANTKLFHNVVDDAHQIKLETEEECHALLDLEGELYILVYPASPANLFLTSALLLTSVILQAIFPEDKQDPGRPPRTSSPSTALGNRVNRARPLSRIPDYYGRNRVTPDLIAKPFTIYDEKHRETEICQMCLGRGQYQTSQFEIYEGDSLARNQEGLSVEVYPPGVLPTFGAPDVLVGAAINEPVRTVYKLEAVNGLRLAPLNEKTLHGTVFQRPYVKNFDEGATGVEYAAMGFVYDGGSVGRILVPLGDPPSLDLSEVTDKITVGDFLEVRFDIGGVTSAPAGSFGRSDRTRILDLQNTSFPSPAPNLSDDGLRYEVTSIFPTAVVAGDVAYCEITIAIPAGKLAAWAAIPAYMIGPSNVMFCVSVLVTPILKANLNFVNEHGAFFIDDPDMTSIVCNFVAERGLFVDDGKNAAAVNPKIAVFVAPADANGAATGAFQRFDFQVKGSSTDTSTRALTAVIDAAAGLAITGRALISVIREDFGLWRVEDLGQLELRFQSSGGGPVVFTRPPLIPIGGPYPPSFWNPPSVPSTGIYAASYKARKGTVEDQVRWTHCYSLSEPNVAAFGDTTLVMTKTVASKSANVRNERKLNIHCTRMTNSWNGTSFSLPLVATRAAHNVFFHILKDPALGNVPNSQIDFAGIVAAFQAVEDHFDDQRATFFDHCFDSENASLEDMLATVAKSCFAIAYREGQTIKVKPDIATDNATILFNHRNIIPESETRAVNFGPEQDYNGARVAYQDLIDNTVKSVTVPNVNATKVREMSIGGIASGPKAMLHAYRVLNRIQHKIMDTEFESTSEAQLASVYDKILVADQTQAVGIQEGEIRGVSGLDIAITQPASISAGGPYTIFLQHVDGTTEAIPVAAAVNSQRLTLGAAPSQPLVVHDHLGVRTKYLLVGATNTKPQAFHLLEKNWKGDGKWTIKASNYSHAYYFADALNVNINPGQFALTVDAGPSRRTLTLGGGATTTSDVTRGSVYSGNGAGDYIDITPSAFDGTVSVNLYRTYTKTCWLNFGGALSDTDIFSMTTGTADAERFLITAAGAIRVFHNGAMVINTGLFPVSGWHHVAATLSRATGTAKVYLDGELLATATGLADLTLAKGGTRAFQGLVGKADDLRQYRRAMSETEIRELYYKTKL